MNDGSDRLVIGTVGMEEKADVGEIFLIGSGIFLITTGAKRRWRRQTTRKART